MKDHFKLSGEQQEVLVAILVVKAGSQSNKMKVLFHYEWEIFLLIFVWKIPKEQDLIIR